MKKLYLGYLTLWICLLLTAPAASAQNPYSDTWNDVLEELSVIDAENGTASAEEMLMELSERMEHPYNVNQLTREQLETLPFLTDRQIENLLAYLYIHGGMRTLYELQLIDEMDRRTMEYLLPFLCVGPAAKQSSLPRFKELFAYGRQELLTRLDLPLYRKKGYEDVYLGTPLYHSLRYTFRYKEQLYAGVTAEKDAGEPLGALHNSKGYDSYSFHVMLQETGCVKALVVGDYRVSFGQGLVANTGFMLGKVASSTSFLYRSKGISKHSSTDENSYFRGVAATIRLGKPWEVSAFYSLRRRDGRVNGDTLASIDESGWHRSETEVAKRNTFTQQVAGGNLSYRHNRWAVGVTGIYCSFSKPYEPELRPYARYNLHGRTFYNIGADYRYRWRKLTLQGEVALGKQGWAVLNRGVYAPSQNYRWMVLHRYYAHNYWALFARSLSESGMQNENGWYLAGEVKPFRYWTFFVSADFFSFPWWKYRISKPSQGVEGVLKAVFSPRKAWNCTVDYRYQQKERDVTGTGGQEIHPVYQHKLRGRMNWLPHESVALRTTCEGNSFYTAGNGTSYGYQVTQAVSYQLPFIKLTAHLQGSYFHTDDYDARVYIPEKGLLHTFYTPSFQGEGIRFSCALRYDIDAYWMLLGKYGQTIYSDRDEIGSGHDLIRGNKKADIQLQLRLKF